MLGLTTPEGDVVILLSKVMVSPHVTELLAMGFLVRSKRRLMAGHYLLVVCESPSDGLTLANTMPLTYGTEWRAQTWLGFNTVIASELYLETYLHGDRKFELFTHDWMLQTQILH